MYLFKSTTNYLKAFDIYILILFFIIFTFFFPDFCNVGFQECLTSDYGHYVIYSIEFEKQFFEYGIIEQRLNKIIPSAIIFYFSKLFDIEHNVENSIIGLN